jgi:UDP-N-acetylglucosamine 2-epimerase (non-hydrolysing)
VTDSITNYFFTTTEVANQTLRQCGISEDRIFGMGNTMIDTLFKCRSRFVQPTIWNEARNFMRVPYMQLPISI